MSIPPSPVPFVGIVTVLYNSDDVLPDFIDSLASQVDVRFRLYIIDNSASDSGCRLARSLIDRTSLDAQIVFNNANVGVAKGNNQGIELALADGCSHVLLANNDTAFGPQTLKHMVEGLRSSEDLACTVKIMYHDHPDVLWYGGGHINAWTLRTPHYGMGQPDHGQFDKQRHVGYAPTCFMLVDAKVFERVGRMDEQYFVYYDDTDFVWRLAQLGIRIRFVAAAVVLHKVSSSTGGGDSPFSVYYSNRNRIYFARKNLRGLQRLTALTYILVGRLARLGLLKRGVAARGWLGVKHGFQLPLQG